MPHKNPRWPKKSKPSKSKVIPVDQIPKNHHFMNKGKPSNDPAVAFVEMQCEAEILADLVTGPYTKADLRDDDYLIRRFPVVQPDKVRMCDDGRPINAASCMDRQIYLSSLSLALAQAALLIYPTDAVRLRKQKVSEVKPSKADKKVEPFSGPTEEFISNWKKYLFPSNVVGFDFEAIKHDTLFIPELESLNIDLEGAYKQIPVRPSELKYNNFVIGLPSGEKHFYRALTLLFGNLLSVVEFLRFADFIRSIFRFCFFIALSNYIDDFHLTALEELWP
jgi:hypothetical protein